MNLEQLLNAYLAFLWDAWKYDIGVYSQWWTYVLLCIPFMFYSIFFIFKWYILLAPITITFSFISSLLNGFRLPTVIVVGKKSEESKKLEEKEKRKAAAELLNKRISELNK